MCRVVVHRRTDRTHRNAARSGFASCDLSNRRSFWGSCYTTAWKHRSEDVVQTPTLLKRSFECRRHRHKCWKSFHLKLPRHSNVIAEFVQVVTYEVDNHEVFCAVLRAAEISGINARPLHRLRPDACAVDLDEEFG